MRALLVGPYPPPFGGIAIHVKRLRLALVERGIETAALAKGSGEGSDPGVEFTKFGSWQLVRRLQCASADVIHVHSYEADYRNIARIASLALLGRPIVLTLHSFRNEPEVGSVGFRLRMPPALRLFSHVICVGPEVQREALRWGAVPARTSIIPSYIPPVPNQLDRNQLPGPVDAFLRDHGPVLSANAYRLSFFRGEDLYGLDLCVELCRRLLPDFPQLGIVFTVAEVGDRVYFDAVQERIRESGLEQNFLLWQSSSEFWPVLERSSVMVRPTNTDSYGVSVAEAIDLGIPAVASDVCERPAGTIHFRSRNIQDLEEKTRVALKRGLDTASSGPRENSTRAANVERIIGVYRCVL